MFCFVARFRTYLGFEKPAPDQVMGHSNYLWSFAELAWTVFAKHLFEIFLRMWHFGSWVFDEITELQIFPWRSVQKAKEGTLRNSQIACVHKRWVLTQSADGFENYEHLKTVMSVITDVTLRMWPRCPTLFILRPCGTKRFWMLSAGVAPKFYYPWKEIGDVWTVLRILDVKQFLLRMWHHILAKMKI